MTDSELLQQNNAMLKTLLKNQAMLNVLIESIIDKVDDNHELLSDELLMRIFKNREDLALSYYKKFMAQVNITMIDPYDENM